MGTMSEIKFRQTEKVDKKEFVEKSRNNGRSSRVKLTICIPTWHDDPSVLLRTLSQLSGAKRCRLLIYDDGSENETLTDNITQLIKSYPGPAMLVTANRNRGRSWTRNRLRELAHTDWLIFIDADMRPDSPAYLTNYLEAIASLKQPSLFVGGYSVKHIRPSAKTRLHAAHAERSDCVPSSVRKKQPGRYVFSSNIMVHRRILTEIQFDPDFKGWGWEDVDWGLRISQQYDVHHIDNTATHMGLETDEALIRKYRRSGRNFARMLLRNKAAMRNTPLFRMASFLSRIPGKPLLMGVSHFMARTHFLPIQMRVFGLKLFRATIYAEYV